MIIFLAVLSLAGGAALGVIETAKSRQEGKTAAFFSKTKELEEISLTEEEVADLTKPSVVRIYHKITGEAKIPSFTIDLDALEIKIDQRKILTVPIDYEILGSGVIVNPSGYIATNAHVASPDLGKFISVFEVFSVEFFKDTPPKTAEGASTASEQERFERAEKLAEKELMRLVEESSFDIVDELKILNPSSNTENLEDTTKNGFPARAVYTEPVESERDISILKIEESRLPALPIEARTELPIGRTVFAFGFPATASAHQKDFLEASFTRGIINAIKNTEMGEFKLYQLDAKISQGSSGGPLLDEKGNIKGIITSQTSEFEQEKGDNFAFAIPSSIVKDALDAASIELEAGAYYINLYAGIQATHEKRCKAALEKFNAARETNGAFFPALVIKKYVDECNRLIEAGESIDSRFDAIYNFFGAIAPLFWMIAAIVILGALAVVVVVFFLRRRISRDEEKIDEFVGSRGNPTLPKTENRGIFDSAARGEFAKKPRPAYLSFLTRREGKKEESVHTDAEMAAITYTKTQFAAGFSEEQIVRALRDAGWRDTTVNKIILFAKIK